MEIQIMEFGQIPRQLFTKPHPLRYGPRDVPRTMSAVSQASSEGLDTNDNRAGNFFFPFLAPLPERPANYCHGVVSVMRPSVCPSVCACVRKLFL